MSMLDSFRGSIQEAAPKTAQETTRKTAAVTGTAVVIDDDAGLRDALTDLFDSAGLACRSYESAEAFIAAVNRGETPLHGCALLDVRLPGQDGMTLLRRLARIAPDFAVIMTTGHGDVPMAVEALKIGAIDFIEKPFDPDAVLEAIRHALGRSAEVKQAHSRAEETRSKLEQLTPREFEVFDRVVAGWTNKQIGAHFGISPRTVELHRARVMKKMEAGTLAELVRFSDGMPLGQR
jgi:two-component system response regulator FixJ